MTLERMDESDIEEREDVIAHLFSIIAFITFENS